MKKMSTSCTDARQTTPPQAIRLWEGFGEDAVDWLNNNISTAGGIMVPSLGRVVVDSFNEFGEGYGVIEAWYPDTPWSAHHRLIMPALDSISKCMVHTGSLCTLSEGTGCHKHACTSHWDML